MIRILTRIICKLFAIYLWTIFPILIVNPAAGLSEDEITMDEINKALDLGKSKALTVIEGALKVLAQK